MNNKRTSSDLRMTDVKFILRKLVYSLMKLREMPTLKEKEVEIRKGIHIQTIQEYTWCKKVQVKVFYGILL